MPDLTTIQNVKQYMQVTDTVSDPVLARLISSFSTWFLNQINRGALIQSTYTEQRNGQGGDSLTAIYWPIQSITSLTIDGQTVPASDGMSPGYWFDSFSVWVSGCYRFRKGRGNVKLVYSAGYPTVPLDVEQAVIDQVVLTVRRQPNLGTTSQQMNGVLTAAFSQKDLAPGVSAVLENYKDKTAVGR